MASIDFDYATMWKHYRDRVGYPTPEVVVKIYSADYVTMKRDANGSLTPFLTRNMSARRMDNNDPITTRHSTIFRHGGYVVFETDGHTAKARRKKLLFIVTPVAHHSHTHGSSYYTADHLSFVVNEDAPPSRRLQMHQTSYLEPGPHVDQDAQGFTARFHNPLPLTFVLSQESPPITHPNLRPMSLAIYDILGRPWTADSRNDKVVVPMASGGGRKQRQQRQRKQRQNNRGPITTFADAWRSLPLHRMTIFALPRSTDMLDVTVFVEDRLHHVQSYAPIAFHFTVTAFDVEHKIQDFITERMAHMQWDDFEEEPLH